MEDFVEGSTVDNLVKEILSLADLNTLDIISEYPNFEEFEKTLINFVRNVLPSISTAENWDEKRKKMVFGFFSKTPEIFMFTPGQIMRLKRLYSQSWIQRKKNETPLDVRFSSNCAKLRSTQGCSSKIMQSKSREALEKELQVLLSNFVRSITSQSNLENNLYEEKVICERDGEDYHATVHCVICNQKFTLKKKGNSPWITSNYYSHVKRDINKLKNQKHDNVTSDTTKGKVAPETTSIKKYFFQAPKESENRGEFEPKPAENIPNIISMNTSEKIDKRSRSDRIKISLMKSAASKNQTSIFHYIEFKRKVKMIIAKNFDENTETLIDILVKMKKKNEYNNVGKKIHGKRYNEDLKLFAVYLYLNGGKFAYESLEKNLEGSLPSLTSVKRTIGKIEDVLECDIRVPRLKLFLIDSKYSLYIWISEDQTKIVEQIVFHKKSNSLLGFVSKLEKNGFPEENAFLATSAHVIKKHFDNGVRASYVNIVMAQPLHSRAPAFCLASYGSNNRFTGNDVVNRWNYLKEKCLEKDIIILGRSADGDPRIMKAMRSITEIGDATCKERPWYHIKENSDIVSQDPVHAATKLKTRLLKKDISLRIGDYDVTSKHLEYLIEHVDKNDHLLTVSDLSAQDKMKFKPVEKISNDLVIESLKKNCNSSNGTVLYLSIIKQVYESYLNTKINCEERIFKIWNVVFIIRAWKVWVLKTKNLTLNKNFITSNTATCLEFNAHCLIVVITELKKNNLSSLFLPWLMTSQPCESMFRAARSSSPNQSTVVNFNMSEFLCRLKKIQLTNDIPVQLEGVFKFPRANNIKLNHSANFLEYALPNPDEINKIVLKALTSAITELKKIGINATETDCYVCACNPVEKKIADIKPIDITQDIQIEMTSTDTDPNIDKLELQVIKENFQFYDFEEDLSVECSEEYKKGAKVKIRNKKTNKIEEIKKSTLCWYLNEDIRKPSVDRTKRFIQSKNIKESTKGSNKISTKIAEVRLQLESYYAVYYDDRFYIGRAIEATNDQVTFKFLVQKLDRYYWPTRDDIDFVERKFVLCNVALIGNCPFHISKEQFSEIDKLYKNFKTKNV